MFIFCSKMYVSKCKRKEGQMNEEKKRQPICPKCNSKNIIAQIKVGKLTCRRCGYVGEREEFFENNYKGGKNEN